VIEEIENKLLRPYAHDYSDSKMLMLKNMEPKRGLDIKEVMQRNKTNKYAAGMNRKQMQMTTKPRTTTIE